MNNTQKLALAKDVADAYNLRDHEMLKRKLKKLAKAYEETEKEKILCKNCGSDNYKGMGYCAKCYHINIAGPRQKEKRKKVKE